MGKLLDLVRTWPSEDQRPFARACFSWAAREEDHAPDQRMPPASILPPWNDPRGSKEALKLWVVRVWELEPRAWGRAFGMDLAHLGSGQEQCAGMGTCSLVSLPLGGGGLSEVVSKQVAVLRNDRCKRQIA